MDTLTKDSMGLWEPLQCTILKTSEKQLMARLMADRNLTAFVGAGFSLQTRSPPPGFVPVLGFMQGSLMQGIPASSHGGGQQRSAILSLPTCVYDVRDPHGCTHLQNTCVR